MSVVPDNLVQNPWLKQQVSEFLPIVNSFVQEAAAEFELPAVIAGGAVRDAAFGLAPNDIDIFIDTSSLSDDEAEDAIVLFGHFVQKKMAERFNLQGEEADLVEQSLNAEAYGRVSSKALFQVYQSHFFTYWRQHHLTGGREIIFVEDGRQEMRDTGWVEEHGTNLQFIGRHDDITDANKLVADFDYGLVRCWVDPETGESCYDGSFVSELNAKSVTAKDETTFHRVDNFKWRFNKIWLDVLKGYPEKKKSDTHKFKLSDAIHNINLQNAVFRPVT